VLQFIYLCPTQSLVQTLKVWKLESLTLQSNEAGESRQLDSFSVLCQYLSPFQTQQQQDLVILSLPFRTFLQLFPGTLGSIWLFRHVSPEALYVPAGRHSQSLASESPVLSVLLVLSLPLLSLWHATAWHHFPKGKEKHIKRFPKSNFTYYSFLCK